MYHDWERKGRESYVPEPIEEKERMRDELRELIEEFKDNGGEIKVIGVLGTETISHKEIREKYRVSDRQIKEWKRSRKWPISIARYDMKKGSRGNSVEKDTYYLRDIQCFFDKKLYEMKDYDRSNTFNESITRFLYR